jgi:hypothetical protein
MRVVGGIVCLCLYHWGCFGDLLFFGGFHWRFCVFAMGFALGILYFFMWMKKTVFFIYELLENFKVVSWDLCKRRLSTNHDFLNFKRWDMYLWAGANVRIKLILSTIGEIWNRLILIHYSQKSPQVDPQNSSINKKEFANICAKCPSIQSLLCMPRMSVWSLCSDSPWIPSSFGWFGPKRPRKCECTLHRRILLCKRTMYFFCFLLCAPSAKP